MKKYNGCGQVYTDVKAAHAVHSTMCPNCMADGEEMQFDGNLMRRVYRIQIIHPDGPPRFTPDISGQDGRTNQGVDLSVSTGGKKDVTSRSTYREELKLAREKSYESTRGEHSRMEPFQKDPNDPNSPVVWEKTTSVSEGFDPGELHPVETTKEVANVPKSSFVKGKTAAELEKELEAKVGPENEGLENVPYEDIKKVSDEMYAEAAKRK
jgi:hypothetical protein